MEVLAHSFIEDLYRFAFLQVGDRHAALACVAEVVSEAESHAIQWRTQKHRFLWAARLLSQRLHRKQDLPGVDAEGLPEPVRDIFAAIKPVRPEMRAGLALYCAGDVKSSEVVQLLRLRSRDWRVVLVRFRDQMATCGISEDGIQQRLKTLQLTSEELAHLVDAVRSLKTRRKGWDKILAVAAVLLGVCVFAGWVGWERWRGSPSMHMRAQMGTLLELNKNVGIAGLETFEGKAGDTQDWLFLHGMEGVRMPDAFAGIRIAAARTLQWNGASVALFPTLTPPGLLVVVESEALGLVEEDAESGRATYGEWSGAWASAGPYKVLWMVQGAPSVLDQYLLASPEAAQDKEP